MENFGTYFQTNSYFFTTDTNLEKNSRRKYIQYYIFSKCKASLKVDEEKISIINPKHSWESRAIISGDVRETTRIIEEKTLELVSNRRLTAAVFIASFQSRPPLFQ
ncbi:hypothetical protein HZS_4489 [Henneguya salminicola]|nr:hypothetical protein HZS_4489 [Henneguya salminicola]